MAIGLLQVNYLSTLICRHGCWRCIFRFITCCNERTSEGRCIRAFSHLNPGIVLHQHRFSAICGVKLASLVDNVCGQKVLLKYIVRCIRHWKILSLTIWADICNDIVHSLSIAKLMTSFAICTLCIWKCTTSFILGEPGIIPFMFRSHEFHS